MCRAGSRGALAGGDVLGAAAAAATWARLAWLPGRPAWPPHLHASLAVHLRASPPTQPAWPLEGPPPLPPPVLRLNPPTPLDL